MEQCKAELCVFCKIIKNEVSLMVGVHVDYIIVSGAQDFSDEFFGQLKQRFLVQNLGEFKMYTGCAFERDWDEVILEMNQTAFAKNMVELSTTFPQLRTFRGVQVCRSWAKKRWRARG